MTLIHVVLVLIVIGVLLWAVNSAIPMDPRIRQIISAVVIVAVVLWLLAAFFPGLGLTTIRVR
jgi:low temperature requirement protein LtrA